MSAEPTSGQWQLVTIYLDGDGDWLRVVDGPLSWEQAQGRLDRDLELGFESTVEPWTGPVAGGAS